MRSQSISECQQIRPLGQTEYLCRCTFRHKGTSNNCHRSSGAPSLPANDSALFSFRFCAVHPKDVRDCQLWQFFEVPIILASQFRALNDSVLDYFMKQDTSQSENDPIAHRASQASKASAHVGTGHRMRTARSTNTIFALNTNAPNGLARRGH